jgi:hypothetical protein
MALPTISEINDAAVRAATRDLAVRRGMDRVMALHGGPTRPGNPEPLVAPTPLPAPPAPAATPKGWDSNKPSSMAGQDAARRQREGKGREGTHAMSADDAPLNPFA